MFARRDHHRRALERNLVWIVGSPRTGSTWLLNLLASHPRIKTIDEPLVGAHLGMAASAVVGSTARPPEDASERRAIDVYRDRADYFFSEGYADAWVPSLRNLLLDRLLAQFTGEGGRPGNDVLVVKEPNGSDGADVLVRSLPESRLLILVRDGRDVVDSLAHALRQGSWAGELARVPDDPNGRRAFLVESAHLWTTRARLVIAASRRLAPESSHLVRYEDLLAEPTAGLRDIVNWLGLPPLEDAEAVVNRFSVEKNTNRGPQQFVRAATPGLWATNFTAQESALVTEIMRDTLTELGYETD